MEPQYMNENRYTYLVGSFRRQLSAVFLSQNSEGTFEQHIQDLFLEGQTHLQQEEFTLALQSFQEAMALILRTVHPTMPIDPNQIGFLTFPFDASIVDALTTKVADILTKTASPTYAFPPKVISDASLLSQQVQKVLQPATATGLQTTSFHAVVLDHLNIALEAVAAKNYGGALASYRAALDKTPTFEFAIRGALQHDLAVLSDQMKDGGSAQEYGLASVASFGQARLNGAQAQALATTIGVLKRCANSTKGGGEHTNSTQVGELTNSTKLGELTRQLERLKSTNNLNEVVSLANFVPTEDSATLGVSLSRAGANARLSEGLSSIASLASATAPAPQAFALDPDAPALFGRRFVDLATSQKALTIHGTSVSTSIVLDGTHSVASAKGFLDTLRSTSDIGLLTGWLSTIQFVAYIPHMYFFVLPMSIADCYAGMGNLEDARRTYLSVLAYPFINQNLEIIKVWTRLARVYLDLGDQAYRNAKDNVVAFGTAKAYYESIIRTDGTLDPASPLYANAQFAGIKTRVTNFLAAPNPSQVNDNPAILEAVLSAKLKLQQIQGALNFFGFGVDYLPPFSFEYLQITARYFAQHASETEQRYIQYKSQAENEEFRREQLNQQAEVARQTVILEQRGVDEAQRGVDVANASLNYAINQVQSAQAAKTDFDNSRWELLELTSLEAWASASSVDRDDQVKLTITGYEYYSADSKRRNVVLQDLAYQRTLLSQDLEAARLDRAIASAQSYQAVAQAQVGQAQARVATAEQRVAIAQLQQRQAEENRDFLDMREFGAKLWYELAQQARRLTQRYLDMATEVAFLMERAYNAETARGLSVIRYDYQSTASGNLMGADLLLADIDSFTFDLVTTTKTKKNPVKRTISLADSYAIQFRRLQSTGSCTFETTLADFDRQHPGLYLTKIRNVELLFIGLAGTPLVAGTLRNIGVSRFRSQSGDIVTRLYPADVMVLSQYQIRQDTLAFRFTPNDLRLFENNGIDTLWQLDLPLDANDLDYSDILDVQLVLYYDGFFDPLLERSVRETLPGSGSASRAVSMKFSAPDELFFLKNEGQGKLVFDKLMFPRTQKNLTRTKHTLKLTGQPETVQGLTLRLTSEAVAGELVLTTDANGEVLDTVAGSPLQSLAGKPVFDEWNITIRAEDNPQLVDDGSIELDGLDDVMIFFEYTFDYR